MPKSPRERLANQLAWVGIALSALVLVAAFIIFRDDDIALVPLTFLVAFASGGLGAILGFLFGIPKMADETRVDEKDVATAKAQRLLFNTNLGQVSDWVTKIVIGLGIAQFDEILEGADWLGGQYATVFGAGLSPSAAATYGLAVTISAATFSFMLAYLWTTTRLPEVWKE